MCGVKPTSFNLSPFGRRLLAEAVRRGEDRAGRAREDIDAENAARQTAGSLEDRIIARALALPDSPQMAQAIVGQVRTFRWLVIVALVLAFAAGMTSARLALGTGGQVNVLLALSALLGVQLLLLLLWLVLMLTPASKKAGPRGSLLGRGLMKLNQWLSRDGGGSEVALATGRVLGQGSLGRWLISAIGHGIWFSYTLGALVICVLLLAIHQYDFYWATTIVPGPAMMNWLAVLGGLPGGLGIPVPDMEVIRASRLGMDPGTGREQWSGLLLGTLVLYGLLPRGLLGLLCFWRAGRGMRRFRLDLTLPGYARLAPRLQAAARPLGRVGAPPPKAATPPPPPVEPLNIQGLIAVAGVELDSGGDWPPTIEGVDWIVLGRADDRDGQRDVLAALSSLPTPPGLLVVVVSLLRTPDRGTGTFLKQVAASAPVMVLLHESGRLRQRGGDFESRVAAWSTLAAGAGIGLVEAFDLNAPDEREALKRRLGYE